MILRIIIGRLVTIDRFSNCELCVYIVHIVVKTLSDPLIIEGSMSGPVMKTFMPDPLIKGSMSGPIVKHCLFH